MKPLCVVAVEHSKCDQYDKTTYFVVPEGHAEEQVRADVRAAQAAYFAALADFEKRYPEPSAWIEWVDQYEDERNGITDAMTIADAKALKAAKLAASQEWRRSRDAAIGSFQTHMATLGYRTPWEATEADDIARVEADWGHYHGKRLAFL